MLLSITIERHFLSCRFEVDDIVSSSSSRERGRKIGLERPIPCVDLGVLNWLELRKKQVVY